ncbi:hypothetical protein [Microbacterium flavum]|uniref:Rv3651-like N-terminal domain-containing protein n=1 Tax=Microbacterium flavum TaxID=415216 RepID=A0ABS5XWS6_9MICO|nr:hypothetical protein [Microbacterium flavum]MBT8798998.1 hypothetical protein [Microbacterium flavum]
MSTEHPVAVIRSLGAEDVIVSWPDLDVGLRAVSVTVMGAPTGAWVFYRPEESEDATLPDGLAAAVHIAADGRLTRFTGLTARHASGSTRHGLWLTASNLPNPDDQGAWRESQQVTVLQPNGRARAITVEGVTAFVLDHGGSARVVVHDGAPETKGVARGGRNYIYSYIVISLGEQLPDEIRVSARDAEHFNDQDLLTAMETAAPRSPGRPPAHALVPWAWVRLTEADKEAAVMSVLREFEHLADYWHGADGSVGPLVRGLANPLVEVDGEWPHTRVDVSFTHPHYPQGRLRRSIRVYDDAGRIRPAMYASIHLMEDLDTMAPPSTDQAHNGVLNI